MFGAILFDVAGTLVTKPLLVPTIASVLREAGLHIDEDALACRHALMSEAVDFPDRTTRQFYEGFNAQLLRALGVPATAALVAEVYDRCVNLPWEPVPGASDLVGLSPRLGVVTNWDRLLHEHLERLGMAFDPIVASSVVGVRKPDPAIFVRALEQLGPVDGEVAYVGNSIRLDVEPAMAAGLVPVLVDPFDLYAAFPGPRVLTLSGLGQELAGLS